MNKLLFSFFLFSILLLSSCHSQSAQNQQKQNPVEEPPSAIKQKFVVVATRASDWSSGAHSVIDYTNSPSVINNNQLPTVSDLAIAAYGKYFYRMERFNSNNISKFSIDDPSKPIWQFSTNEAGVTQSNPYSIVFASQTKAYLLRYGSSKMWIVNPSATIESEFKIAEVDLSLYGDQDLVPEMASAIIVKNRLFVALQRVDMTDFGIPSNTSYIAVIDTDTNTEIETGQGNNDCIGGVKCKGISLSVRNPYGKIKYNKNDDFIYVAAADNLYDSSMFGGIPQRSTYGGIQRINASTYVADTNIIAPNKNITSVDIASANKGYFVEYVNSNSNALKSFDPTTKNVSITNVAGIGDSGNRNISDIAVDTNGLLWIADSSSSNSYAGVYSINILTDSIVEGPVSTDLLPVEIAFCEK